MALRLTPEALWGRQYTDDAVAAAIMESLAPAAKATWTRLPQIFAVTNRSGESLRVKLGDWVIVNDAHEVVTVLAAHQARALTMPPAEEPEEPVEEPLAVAPPPPRPEPIIAPPPAQGTPVIKRPPRRWNKSR